MMEHFTEDWRRFGVDAWNEVPNHWRPGSDEPVGWWTLPTYLGDSFVAPLLGAPKGTCIWQPNVHWTVQCLLSAPELRNRGSEIVLPDTAFPSLLHSAHRWSDVQDWTPRPVAGSAADRPVEDALLETIGPDTALVALSHVGFATGARMPDDALSRLAACAHEHDALLLVDGYHAVGTMPIDVTEFGCDAYVGGLLKHGCGASGNAFLYLRQGLKLTPHLTGWFGDAAPFAFRPHPEPHPDVRRRFLGGTTPIAPMYHAVEGVRLLLNCGLDAVRSHSRHLTERAIERAEAAGLPLRSPRTSAERGAMVVLEVPKARRMTKYLKQKNIYTDSRRNEVIRMAPFVWNTTAEVDRTFDRIEKGLSSGTYLEAGGSRAGPIT